MIGFQDSLFGKPLLRHDERVPELWSCALLWAVTSCGDFVLSSLLRSHPWSPDLKHWAYFLETALGSDPWTRLTSSPREVSWQKTGNPSMHAFWFGCLSSLGGFYCAKQVPIGKEWGWDKRGCLLGVSVCRWPQCCSALSSQCLLPGFVPSKPREFT